MSKHRLTIDQRRLTLSNLEKVFYPASGFTKGQMIDYYRRIAPVILPHLSRRPVTLKRYPEGADGPFFYEKRCPSHRPDWVATADVPTDEDESIAFCQINDEPSLVWVANLASIELHTLLSLADRPDQPTMMVFDLDPGEPASLLDSLRTGLLLRGMLAGMGLKSWPKTSGGKGLHVYVPLNTPVSFQRTKSFARAVAEVFERQDPRHVVSRMRKDLRAGKVLIDWSQNDRHKTTVCPYSMRARARPTVSTPLSWEEVEQALKRQDIESITFEAAAVLSRVNDLGDLFAPVLRVQQTLPDGRLEPQTAPDAGETLPPEEGKPADGPRLAGLADAEDEGRARPPGRGHRGRATGIGHQRPTDR